MGIGRHPVAMGNHERKKDEKREVALPCWETPLERSLGSRQSRSLHNIIVMPLATEKQWTNPPNKPIYIYIIGFNEQTKTNPKQTHIETTSQKWLNKAKIHKKTWYKCGNHSFQSNFSSKNQPKDNSKISSLPKSPTQFFQIPKITQIPQSQFKPI